MNLLELGVVEQSRVGEGIFYVALQERDVKNQEEFQGFGKLKLERYRVGLISNLE